MYGVVAYKILRDYTYFHCLFRQCFNTQDTCLITSPHLAEYYRKTPPPPLNFDKMF